MHPKIEKHFVRETLKPLDDDRKLVNQSPKSLVNGDRLILDVEEERCDQLT